MTELKTAAEYLDRGCDKDDKKVDYKRLTNCDHVATK